MHYNYIIAATNKQKITPIKFEFYQKAHHLWHTAYNWLAHTVSQQARTVLKTSTDNHFSSYHSHQLLRSSKTKHYQHFVDVLFHDVGVRLTKGVDHFGDCFVRVRPVNRLFSCKHRTFGQMSGLSTYFPFSLAFYFAIILTTRRSLCTRWQLRHVLPTWRRSDNRDVSARNR